jgi:hypothetical protein
MHCSPWWKTEVGVTSGFFWLQDLSGGRLGGPESMSGGYSELRNQRLKKRYQNWPRQWSPKRTSQKDIMAGDVPLFPHLGSLNTLEMVVKPHEVVLWFLTTPSSRRTCGPCGRWLAMAGVHCAGQGAQQSHSRQNERTTDALMDPYNLWDRKVLETRSSHFKSFNPSSRLKKGNHISIHIGNHAKTSIGVWCWITTIEIQSEHVITTIMSYALHLVPIVGFDVLRGYTPEEIDRRCDEVVSANAKAGGPQLPGQVEAVEGASLSTMNSLKE